MTCWGRNDYGKLGGGAYSNDYLPVDVSGLSGVVDFTIGVSSTCAALADGAVKCWGSNLYGALGVDYEKKSTIPVSVQGL